MQANPQTDRIAAALTSERGIGAAYLFGSVAEERAHRDSDIDIAVLLDWHDFPTRDARFDARLRLIGAIGHALGRNDLDLIVLNDVPSTFARAILDRGQPLLVMNTAAEHAFRRDTMLRAADLDPFLRRMRRLTLDALTR